LHSFALHSKTRFYRGKAERFPATLFASLLREFAINLSPTVEN
jgi:hypothetical protein